MTRPVGQNTYPLIALQGSLRATVLAFDAPVRSPLERCLLVFVAARQAPSTPARFSYMVAAKFCAATEGQIEEGLKHLIHVGALETYDDGFFVSPRGVESMIRGE